MRSLKRLPGRSHLLPFLCSICLIFFYSATKTKTQKIVSGTVVNSSSGVPVEGATVRPKGSKSATSTHSLGAFTVSVPSAATTLIISSVGYKEAEIAIDASGTMNVQLVKADQDLDDVVVVAYGTQKKVPGKFYYHYRTKDVKRPNQ